MYYAQFFLECLNLTFSTKIITGYRTHVDALNYLKIKYSIYEYLQ